MNKTEFVKAVAAESGLTGVEAAKAVAAMQKVVAGSMQRGERIVIPGFGSFSVMERKARTGRNPRTGERMKIAARKAVKFTPGRNLQPESPAPEIAAKKPAGKGGGKKTRDNTLF